MRLRIAAATLMAGAALLAESGTCGELQQPSVLAVQGQQLALVFSVMQLVYVVADVGGKTKDLEVKESKTEIHIDLAADVLFDFDKSTLRPSARDTLHQAASIIRSNAKASTVRIDGYTDSKGSDSYNQQLSNRRAEAVRIWLVDIEGLKNVSFATSGYGAKNPVAPNSKPDGLDDPDGRQKNRRVEITIKKS
jgi:outer membrane protein OmpA-like peptidoglycan-associated protein